MPIRQGTANLKRKFNGIVEVNFIRQGIVLIYKSITQFVSDYSARVLADVGTFEGLTNVTTLAQNLRNSDLFEGLTLGLFPSGVKASRLYSVIPENGNGDLTVVRNTTATRVNSSGLIEDVSVNVPRINYDSAGGIPFILDEPQRTNFIKFSNTITDSSWDFGSTNVIRSIAPTSPHLTNPAYRLTSTTSTSFSRITGVTTDINVASNNVATRVYLRADVPFTGSLRRRVSNNQVLVININITNIWQAFEILTSTSGTSHDIHILLNSNGISGNSVTGRTLDIFNVQMEEGLKNTSNILTDSSAVTRNADVITVAPPAGTVKITTTFSDNTTQIITSVPALFTVPEGLIKQVLMQNSL